MTSEAKNEDENEPDRLLLSLNLHHKTSHAPIFVKARAEAESAVESGDTVNLSFATKEIEASGYLERQQLFERAHSELLTTLREIGITAEMLSDTGSVLALSLSLIAGQGQAGIVLTSELIAEWAQFPVDNYIDAL